MKSNHHKPHWLNFNCELKKRKTIIHIFFWIYIVLITASIVGVVFMESSPYVWFLILGLIIVFIVVISINWEILDSLYEKIEEKIIKTSYDSDFIKACQKTNNEHLIHLKFNDLTTNNDKLARWKPLFQAIKQIEEIATKYHNEN